MLGSALLISLFGLAAAFAGAGRDLVIAYLYGTSDIVDAYVVALLLPNLAVAVTAMALGPVTSPQFIAARERGDNAGAAALAEQVMALGLGFFGLLAILLDVLAGPATRLLTLGFAADKAEMTKDLYLVLIPMVVLQGWSTVMGALINARERFALVAAAPILRPLAVIALLLLMGRSHPIALALGLVVGLLLETAAIAALAARLGLPLRPRWRGLTPPLRAILRQYGPMALTMALTSGFILVDQYLASLLPAGSVAAFNYGTKLYLLMIGIGALPLGAVALPNFAQQVSRGEWRALRRALGQWIGIVLVAAGLVALLGTIYAEPITRLVFERGAFSGPDTALVARVQAFLLWHLPFFLSSTLFAALLTVLQRSRIMSLAALTNAGVNFLGALVLMRVLGIAGIALALGLGHVAGWCVQLAFVWRALRRAP